MDVNASHPTGIHTSSLAPERLLSDVVAHLPGIIYRATVTSHHHIHLSFVSDGIEALVGLSAEAAIAQSTAQANGWLFLIHPSDRAAVYATVMQAIATLSPVRQTYRIVTATGQSKWIHDQAQVAYTGPDTLTINGLLLEVPPPVPSPPPPGHALEHYLAKLSDQSSDVVMSFDRDYRVLYLNPMGQQVFELDSQSNWPSLDRLAQYPRWAWERITQEGIPWAMREGLWMGETAILTAEGQEIPVSQRIIAHHRDDQSIDCFVTVLRDISDRNYLDTLLRRQSDQERRRLAIAKFLAAMTQRIHQAPHLDEVLNHTAIELRHFLQANRVLVLQRSEDDHLTVCAESVDEQWPSPRLQAEQVKMPSALEGWVEKFSHCRVKVFDHAQLAKLPDSIQVYFHGQSVQTETALVASIHHHEHLWGLIVLQHCVTPYCWNAQDIEMVRQLMAQIGIAIRQLESFQTLQKANVELERKYQLQNAQLKLAFEFEATLKRITDKVRDSLDENQILQTAVQELTTAIGVSGCNAALYDLEQGTSTICYEYAATVSPSQGRVADLYAFPEIYTQLFKGHAFQFCSIVPNPVRGHVSMLACPIWDDQGILGDLWLINHKFYAFSEQDIRLVQQVANQCAIALRQARLYQASQSQVAELERLNQLKDDFLSTVSHELRTPIASIKMASQMLELKLTVGRSVEEMDATVTRYLRILQAECDREISLINDLLDLSRLEAEAEPLRLQSLVLQDWLTELIKPFAERACKQQQQFTLDMPPDALPMQSDFAKLERILSELLQNACKYTPPQERIGLRIEIREEIMRIHVMNSGVEIPMQERSRIFERFYRIPNADPWKHGGTGLGLALVKKLVEQLGGMIEVESDQEQTDFILTLPLNPQFL